MYLPNHFNNSEPKVALQIMREHPFAAVTVTDGEGFPCVAHIPIHSDLVNGEFVLLGHVARGNPLWKHLQSNGKGLVNFLGPHAYMSPKVYPDLARVPTWNYLEVECRVQARILEPHIDKDALLKALISDHEPEYAAQWRAMDSTLAGKLLDGIAAFELKVTQWQCKIKLNQHRKESHVALYERYANGTADERALAKWMKQLEMVGSDQ
jgi:transcriptional regulator